MDFQVSALDVQPFRHLFALSDEELANRGVHRMRVTDKPGFPCRISLRDAEVGDTVLLLNHEHLHAATPYRASHAIFVGEGVVTATPAVNDIPGFLRCRLLSARAFDGGSMMRDAKVVPGEALGPVLEELFADEAVDFIHLHNAARGCYLAQVDRVGG